MVTPLFEGVLAQWDLDDWGAVPNTLEGQSRTSGKFLDKGPEGASECGEALVIGPDTAAFIWARMEGRWHCA